MKNEKTLDFRLWALGLLLIAVLCPLTAVHAAQREFSKVWKVETSPAKKESLSWFAGDTITLNLTSTQNGSALDLTGAVLVWELRGWSDYTNLYAVCTGEVVLALSGTSRFELTSEQTANLPETCLGYAKAVQTNGNSVVLGWQSVKTEWADTTGEAAAIEALPTPYVTDAELSVITNALWEAISSATDTNLAAVVATATNDIADLTSDLGSLTSAVVLRTDLDGGWFYPDWFDWSFSQVADGIPDSTTVITNNDVILDRNVYSSLAGSFEITYYDTRSTDFSVPAVTSASPSVATATVSKVSYVSTGNAEITATLGDFSRTTNLVMEVISVLTNDVVTGCVTGSAVCAFADGIDSRLTDGSDLAVYTTQDHAATNYVRNPSSWVAGLDLTCVSPWNSLAGRLRAGTLIGSDCILMADHYPISLDYGPKPWKPGASLRFITSDNRVITRTITAFSPPIGGDILLAKLNSPISTNDCRPAMLMPSDAPNYMPYTGNYNGFMAAAWIDQYENAHVADFGLIMRWNIGLSTPTDSTRLLYSKFPVHGDSGSPLLFIARGYNIPIIAGTWHGAYSAPFTSYYNASIRSGASVMGCDTDSIVDADFEAMGFTNFKPPPPTP